MTQLRRAADSYAANQITNDIWDQMTKSEREQALERRAFEIAQSYQIELTPRDMTDGGRLTNHQAFSSSPVNTIGGCDISWTPQSPGAYTPVARNCEVRNTETGGIEFIYEPSPDEALPTPPVIFAPVAALPPLAFIEHRRHTPFDQGVRLVLFLAACVLLVLAVMPR